MSNPVGRPKTLELSCACGKKLRIRNSTVLNGGEISRYCECLHCNKRYRVKNGIKREIVVMRAKDEPLKIITRKAAMDLGLLRYYTGVPCKYGHVSEKTVKGKSCMECNRIRMKRWRDAEKIESVIARNPTCEDEIKGEIIPGARVFLMGKRYA